MSVIARNEYGAVGVNKSVIEKMIIEDVLAMPDSFLLCNKKGKPIKDKPTPWLDPDHYDAIDVTDKRGDISVKLYVITKKGTGISDLADSIFESVENVFELLRLAKPKTINVKVKGIMSDTLEKRSIEVVRNNA